jgi:hypothetical protein
MPSRPQELMSIHQRGEPVGSGGKNFFTPCKIHAGTAAVQHTYLSATTRVKLHAPTSCSILHLSKIPPLKQPAMETLDLLGAFLAPQSQTPQRDPTVLFIVPNFCRHTATGQEQPFRVSPSREGRVSSMLALFSKSFVAYMRVVAIQQFSTRAVWLRIHGVRLR